MPSRTVIDRRHAFAHRQRLALSASLVDFSKLTVEEARYRVRELARAGADDVEMARLIGLPLGIVRCWLEPETLRRDEV